MTDATQIDAEDPFAPVAGAQDAPEETPAPEVEPEEEPAVDPVPATPETPPVEPVTDETDETEEEVEAEAEERVHNPSALRGVPAGPPPHPRTV